MKNKIGQLMFIGISGPSLTQSERQWITDHNIGGVILFGRNCVDPKQLRELNREIFDLQKSQSDRAPLFISVDMEGGRVHRLKKPFTQWPSLSHLGRIDNPTASFQFAYLMGLELRAAGFNLNFAPCLDILTNPKNTAIGDRSLSDDAERVGKHASALIRGYIKAGIISCAKHFPGHGNTFLDSHEELPTESVDLETLRNREFSPFKKAFRAKADLVMTAHIRYEKIDPQFPATLSKIIIQNILKNELRYQGLTITDDLGMKAITKYHSVEDTAVMALLAGQDLLLYCNEPDAPPRAYEGILEAIAQGKIPQELIEQTHRRVLEFKKSKAAMWNQMAPEDADRLIGSVEHQKFADEVRSENVTIESPSEP